MDVYAKLADPAALAVFAATLLLPVVVGFLSIRRTRDESDFFVGGRAMDKVVVALSAVASGRSSWLVLALSGMAWKMGTSAVWAIVGYVTVEAVQFVTIGKRLRRAAEEHGSITLLDYFESRLGDGRHVVRIVGAVVMTVFLTAYVSAQLHAGAKSLASALDLPLGTCLAASGMLTLAYMVLGGYVAVAYNDVIRAVIMIVALLMLPAVGIAKLGGPGGVVSALDPAHLDPFALSAGALAGFLGIGLGSPGQPHIVVRYMSIDDPGKLWISAIVGTFWNVVLGLGAVCIGLVGRAAVPGPEGLPNADSEMIYLVLSARWFGPVLYGLLVGGVFAAILSTVDSQLLAVASTIVRDVWEKTMGRGGKQGLLIGRIVVVVAGVAAMILAYGAEDLVFWLVLFAWGGLGASLGPPLILCLYWKRTTRWGVVAGMIAGTATTIVWSLYLKKPTGVYELIPAFFLSALAVVLVSLATPLRGPAQPSPPGAGR